MRLNAAVCIGLVLVIFAIYGQTRNFGWVNLDDGAYIYDNPPAQRGLSAESVRWAFTTVYLANYAPLTWLSFFTDFARSGMDPGTYHVTNVVLHAANAVLLFLLLVRLTAAAWPSAFIAALFAVHPLHVESVAWVSSRKDVLSTFFALLALLAYVQFTRASAFRWYLAASLAFVCSLLAKSMWITMPCVLLLLDLWPLRRATLARADSAVWRRLAVEKLPLFAVSAVSAVVTVYAQRAGGAMPGQDLLGLRTRIANAFVSYVRYLALTVWPDGLIPYYIHPKDALSFGLVAGAVSILVAVTAAAWLLRNSRPYLFVGWFWYLGTLVPVIGIVQVGGQAMADRYTYVPLIGIFIAAAWGLADFVRAVPRLRIAATAACLCAVGALSVLAHQQTARWQSSITLFEYTLSVDPENSVALGNLGEAFYSAGRYADAQRTIARALHLRPGDAGNLSNLSATLRKLGRLDEAVAAARRSLEIDPESPRAYNHLSLASLEQGNVDDAEAALNRALALDPEFLDAHVNAGNLLLRRGNLPGAAEKYEYVLERRPRDADAISNLGTVRLLEGDYDGAIARFRAALAIAPRDAVIRTNLAVALQQLGNHDEARREAEAALRADPNYQKARGLLEDLDSAAANSQH
jgi:protein O-mannosyl-transferase